MSKVTVSEALRGMPWAISEEWLRRIEAIAERQNDSVEALEKQAGRPLRNTREVTTRTNSHGVVAAIVPITGPIFRHANLFTEISGATALGELITDFQKAAADPSVDVIIPVFDTPGGQAASIAEFATYVSQAGKPVIGYVDDMCASAGYWIASACSRLYASSTAEIGSVGAVITLHLESGKSTTKVITNRHSPKKRLDPGSDEAELEYQTRVDDLAEIFIADVATYRGVDVSRVISDFGQGGVMIAGKALAAGMIDGITTFEALLESLTRQTVDTLKPSQVDASPIHVRRAQVSPANKGTQQTQENVEMSILTLLGITSKDGEDDKAAQARLERLNSAFGNDEDMKAFALSEFKAGHDVHEAVVVMRDQHASEVATLNDENTRLTGELTKATESLTAEQKKTKDLSAKVADLEKRQPLVIGAGKPGSSQTDDSNAGSTDADEKTKAAAVKGFNRGM